jgi:hypothetical protein
MLLFLDNQVILNEEELGNQFNSLSLQQKYSLKLLLANANFSELKFSIPSSIFIKTVKDVIAMTCLIMEYDNECTIDNIILGFIFKIYQSEKFNFVEYLSDVIHEKIV